MAMPGDEPAPRPATETAAAAVPAWLADLSGADATRRRRAIAKAITLVESTQPAHRAEADALLAALPAPPTRTLRLGISGVPGVGKSTFIEALGLAAIAAGHRVAVLAVDPSSALSGGSILGDKTRMEQLSLHPGAYVRPSPSRGTLGGVAAATRDAIAVVEAAGCDVVLVETVGVGQSEAQVAAMTDLFVLLQLPNAGDELQAVKKGVLEVADLVVVNKADLDPAAAARAAGQLESAWRAAHVQGRAKPPPVLQTSAVDPARVAALWQEIAGLVRSRHEAGAFAERRRRQVREALRERGEQLLLDAFRRDPATRALAAELEGAVASGQLPLALAARQLVARHAGRDGA